MLSCSRAAVILLVLTLSTSPLLGQGLGLLGTWNSGLGEGATEIAAFDPASKRLFVVNATNASVDILDLSDLTDPQQITGLDVTPYGGGANSVAVANGWVAVAVEADTKQDDGRVVFFDTDGLFLHQITVGALPDMVTFTPDGQKLLVANEGEPNDDYTVDPEGSVSIIDLSGGLLDATETRIGFTDFNADGPRAGELSSDVRIFGPGATVAQDLEPEYIAISEDSATAWVALQEANALAVIDIAAGTVTRIDALGLKDHSQPANAMDASNRDDGIQIRNWPTFGMYQPDGIAAFQVGGETYVATANEGDSRDYDGYSEEERVKDLTLDPTAFPDADTLQMDENLGRLKTTSANGDLDGDGDVDQIYSYGARSFSIWSGTDGSLVYDSANEFEQITAAQVPAIFNSDQSNPDEFDDRSDDKGPEPETVVIGQMGDALWAFIGLERVGGVMVYDVTDPTAPEFLFYEPSAAGDFAPEGVIFVDPADSPIGEPLLILSNEDSGTVSIYRISALGTGTPSCAADPHTLCLQNNRFAVRADFAAEGEEPQQARAQAFTDNTGYFWFFSEDNVEITLKVLDACDSASNHFWVFAAGMTSVEVALTITDTVTGEVRSYDNPQGTAFLPVQDTSAFQTCP